MVAAEPKESGGERLIIVGPSHVVRWQHAVSTGAIEPPAEQVEFIGGGGLPIWSAELEARCRASFREGDRLFLVVGDFRFGNAICAAPEYISSETFLNGFRNVERQFIDPAVDLSLFRRSLRALEAWRQRYGSRIRILHWNSLIRRAEDMWIKRYMDGGFYRHPIWQFDKLLSEDLEQLSPAPIIRVRSLAIDSNLHPSPLGYRFLSNRAANMRPVDSLREAVSWLCLRLQSIFERPLEGGLLIAGDSVFIGFCKRVLIGEPLEELAKLGISFFFGEIDRVASYVRENRISSLIMVSPLTSIKEVDASFAGGSIVARFGGRIRAERVRVIPWEIIARNIVSRRHRNLTHLNTESREKILHWLRTSPLAPSGFTQLDDLDRAVDLGEELMPTLAGLELILSLGKQLSGDV